MRAPKVDEHNQPVLAPADRFFSYKHYLDGNGELLDKEILKVIAKAMIRNKADSYCQAWDVMTTGISAFVNDLRRLYGGFGAYMPTRPGHLMNSSIGGSPARREGGGIAGWWRALVAKLMAPPKRAAGTKTLPPRRGPGQLPPGNNPQ